MPEEIKQPRNIARVQPSNPSRNTAQRKRPRQAPARPESDGRDRHPVDDQPHQVDEYV
jgi:hypothetical protein